MVLASSSASSTIPTRGRIHPPRFPRALTNRNTATDEADAAAAETSVQTMECPGASRRYMKLRKNPMIASPINTGLDLALLLPTRIDMRAAEILLVIRMSATRLRE
jgi:hypothetical protein